MKMSFEFVQTEFDGLYIIENHTFEDARGGYCKHFEQEIFARNNIDFTITESSDLYTNKGAIRGLHYQEGDSQAKLVRAIKGKIFDVAVDLRAESKTYMKVFTIILTEENKKSMLIPKGFAHGFLALEDNTVFAYHCYGEYIPELCGGLRWNDPKLNINWPLEEYDIKSLIITEKDKNWKFI